jgi:PhnB protein
MTVKPIPDGFHSISPYLIVKGAADAIEFYKKAFNATEVMRLGGPGGTVAHAEIRIGDSVVMMADENPGMNAFAPQGPGKSGMGLCLYVENVDEMVSQAMEAGAIVQRP